MIAVPAPFRAEREEGGTLRLLRRLRLARQVPADLQEAHTPEGSAAVDRRPEGVAIIGRLRAEHAVADREANPGCAHADLAHFPEDAAGFRFAFDLEVQAAVLLHQRLEAVCDDIDRGSLLRCRGFSGFQRHQASRLLLNEHRGFLG